MTDEERKLVLSVFPEIENIIFKLAEKICKTKANPVDIQKVDESIDEDEIEKRKKTFKRVFYVKFYGENFKEYQNIASFMRNVTGKPTETSRGLVMHSGNNPKICIIRLKREIKNRLKQIRYKKEIERIARITIEGTRIEA